MRITNTRAARGVVAVVAAGALAAAPAASADGAEAPTPRETVAALTEAAPEVMASGTLAEEPTGTPSLELPAAAADTAIASDPADGFAIAAPGQEPLQIKPVGVEPGASDTVPIAGGEAAVSVGTDPGVSTVIKPHGGGISTYTVIAGPEAPERYSWEVGVDETVTLGPDGGAVVTDGAGAVVASVPPPWAKDRNGVELTGVHFEADGRRLTLVVPHGGQNVEYGVVADPIWFAIGGAIAHAARGAAAACGGGVAASAVYSIVTRGRRALSDIRNNWQRACVESVMYATGLRFLLR